MKNEELISAMKTVEEFSTALNSTSWVWGGLTADVYAGKILREHHDLDYLTLHLHEIFDPLSVQFQNTGWSARPLSNGDLKLEKDGVKIHLGHIDIGQDARWTHNGDLGSLYFPQQWLVSAARNFCGLDIHVVAPQLQYVLLAHPELLNPDWEPREQDHTARAFFNSFLETSGIDIDRLRTLIHD